MPSRIHTLIPLSLAVTLACTPTFTKDSGGSGGGDGADGAADGADGGSDGADGGTSNYPTILFNELMSSNTATITDESGRFPDWVELYNPGGADVSLDGWVITDDLEEDDKHPFEAGLVVPAGGFLLLWADDDEPDGANHLSFNLAAEGEELGLYDPDGGAADEVEFGALGSDVSAAREPDGSANWVATDSPTPGASNGG